MNHNPTPQCPIGGEGAVPGTALHVTVEMAGDVSWFWQHVGEQLSVSARQGVRWAGARTQSTFPRAVQWPRSAFQGLRRAEGEEPSIGRHLQWNGEHALQERVSPCQVRGVLPGRQQCWEQGRLTAKGQGE